MEPVQHDNYAFQSQRVNQQVLTKLAPNVEVVRSCLRARRALHDRSTNLNAGRSSVYKQSEKVLNHICRSWRVLRGVLDDRFDEVEIEEVRANGWANKSAPKDSDPLIEEISRRFWPGSEDGSSDWRDDWHSILQVEGESVTA